MHERASMPAVVGEAREHVNAGAVAQLCRWIGVVERVVAIRDQHDLVRGRRTGDEKRGEPGEPQARMVHWTLRGGVNDTVGRPDPAFDRGDPRTSYRTNVNLRDC